MKEISKLVLTELVKNIFAVFSPDDKATCVRALKSREWLMDKVITPCNIYSDICKKETHQV